MKYNVLRRFFHQGGLYHPGDTIELNEKADENLIYRYRSYGYIGSEIKPAKRKGRRVKRRAVTTK